LEPLMINKQQQETWLGRRSSSVGLGDQISSLVSNGLSPTITIPRKYVTDLPVRKNCDREQLPINEARLSSLGQRHLTF
jgi:hypothetical protein